MPKEITWALMRRRRPLEMAVKPLLWKGEASINALASVALTLRHVPQAEDRPQV